MKSWPITVHCMTCWMGISDRPKMVRWISCSRWITAWPSHQFFHESHGHVVHSFLLLPFRFPFPLLHFPVGLLSFFLYLQLKLLLFISLSSCLSSLYLSSTCMHCISSANSLLPFHSFSAVCINKYFILETC